MNPGEENQPASTELETYLAFRDTPCPACGYNLRGLKGNRCPECGGSVAVEHLKQWFPRGAYRTGLAALLLGLLAHVLAIIFLFRLAWPFSHETAGAWSILYALLKGTAVDVALLAAWYWSRVRIGRSRAAIRWLVAVLLFPIAVLGIVLAAQAE